MTESVKELRELSRAKLIENHDKIAPPIQPTSQHYLAELARRDLGDHNRVMTRLTCAIVGMTLVMTLATIINVVLFALGD